MRILALLLVAAGAVTAAENPCQEVMDTVRADLGAPGDIIETQTEEGTHIAWDYPAKNVHYVFYWTRYGTDCFSYDSLIDRTSYRNEPDGFRNIKWDTPLKKIPGMKFIMQAGSEKYYVKKKDELKIGGAVLNNILYGFSGGKFSSVMITCSGHKNASSLEATLIKKFGEGEKSDSLEFDLVWDGPVTRTAFDKNRITGDATLLMISKKWLTDKWEKDEQAARTGAENDF